MSTIRVTNNTSSPLLCGYRLRTGMDGMDSGTAQAASAEGETMSRVSLIGSSSQGRDGSPGVLVGGGGLGGGGRGGQEGAAAAAASLRRQRACAHEFVKEHAHDRGAGARGARGVWGSDA